MIFYIAMVLFVANFALGVLVQFRIVDTKPFRWLHHALFFAVFAFLPRVRAGSPGHAALASGAVILYVTGFVWML